MSNLHTFNRAAKETMDKSIAICEQRAEEYQDSWDLNNLQVVYLRSTLRSFGITLEPIQERLLVMASMNDIKLSRMTGPFKEDNHIDLNNYNSAYCTLRREYEDLQKGLYQEESGSKSPTIP